MITEICARLDGLPLAIELAAARMATLSVQLLNDRLADRFRLLNDGPRDLPDRQRTLWNTIDWSYSLLADHEQRLLRQLAFFPAGWSLDVVDALDSAPAFDSLNGLMSLVKQCLATQQEQPDGDTRFVMLESMREFGVHLARKSGEEAGFRAWHAAWVASLLDRIAPLEAGSDLIPDLNRLEIEHANIQAALDWTITSQDPVTGWRIAGNAWLYWWIRNHLSEGRLAFSRLLELPYRDVPPQVFALGLTGTGVISEWSIEFEESAQLHDEAVRVWSTVPVAERRSQVWSHASMFNLALRRGGLIAAQRHSDMHSEFASEHDDALLLATAACNRGILAYFHGDPALAEVDDCEFLKQARRFGNPWLISLALGNLANDLLNRGTVDGVEPLINEALALSRDMGHVYQIMGGLSARAAFAMKTGRLREAADDLREQAELARWFTNFYEEATALHNLGTVLTRLQRPADALAAYRGGLHLADEHAFPAVTAACLVGIANLLVDDGQAEPALQLAAAAQSLRQQHGIVPVAEDHDDMERLLTTLRSVIPDDRFEAGWSTGVTTALGETVRLALSQPLSSNTVATSS